MEGTAAEGTAAEPVVSVVWRAPCGQDLQMVGGTCPAGVSYSTPRELVPACKSCPHSKMDESRSIDTKLSEPLPTPAEVSVMVEQMVGKVDEPTPGQPAQAAAMQLPAVAPPSTSAPQAPEIPPASVSVGLPVVAPPMAAQPLPAVAPPQAEATVGVSSTTAGFGMPQQQVAMAQPQLQTQQPQVQGPGFAIPADMLAKMQGESQVDIDSVGELLGMKGGPSEGGISWHTYEPFAVCERRFYWERIMGIVPKYTPEYFAFGTLYHWTMELHRGTGGRRTFEAIQAAESLGGATAEMAKKVYVLARTAIMHHGPAEQQLWDVRAIEHNMVFWLPPVEIEGKQVRIPISCRSDLITRVKPGYNMENLPAGTPSPEGVYILDEKTAGRMSHRTIRGYLLDGQFMTNAVVFINSRADLAFGRLNGVIVSVAVKHAEPEPSKSLAREELPLIWDATQEFYTEQLLPGVVRLYRKLVRPDREDKKLWPKTIATHHCQGPYGLCPYFDVCAYGDSMTMNVEQYKKDEGRILKLEVLLPPPKDLPMEPMPLDTPELAEKLKGEQEKKAAKAASRKRVTPEEKEAVLAALRSGYLSLTNANGTPTLAPEVYMGPGVTEAKMLAAVAKTLENTYALETQWKVPVQMPSDVEQVEFVIAAKGVSWRVKNGKATSTWRQIAASICSKWWDPANVVAALGGKTS